VSLMVALNLTTGMNTFSTGGPPHLLAKAGPAIVAHVNATPVSPDAAPPRIEELATAKSLVFDGCVLNKVGGNQYDFTCTSHDLFPGMSFDPFLSAILEGGLSPSFGARTTPTVRDDELVYNNARVSRVGGVQYFWDGENDSRANTLPRAADGGLGHNEVQVYHAGKDGRHRKAKEQGRV
jgi:hypothetical protein